MIRFARERHVVDHSAEGENAPVVVPHRVTVRCDNCGESVEMWREPVEQEDRAADQYGPAVHVILGGGWVLHRCFIAMKWPIPPA